MALTKITTNVIGADAVTSAKIPAGGIVASDLADDLAIPGNPTAATQSAGNNTTRIATTAFVQTAVDALVDSAPGTMNTLNEIAAALNDDANAYGTLNTSINAKLPLTGGTLTGALTMSVSPTVNNARVLVQRSGDDASIAFADNASGTPSSHCWALGYDQDQSNGFAIAYASNGIPSLSGSNKLQLTTAGKLGLGTASPGAYLHITTNDSTTNDLVNGIMITTLSTGTTTTGFGGEIRFQGERNNGVNQNTGRISSIAEVNSGADISSGLGFWTGTAGVLNERIRIKYNGNVGIGTIDPTYKLDVNGDMGVNEYIYHNDDTNTYMRFQNDSWLVRAGGDDRIYVDGTNGRVGIGTNSPTAELDVRGGSAGGTHTHAVFTGTTGRGLIIKSRSDTAGGQHNGTAEIGAQDSEGNGGQLAFSTGGTIRAFLNHTGLMVGTADGPDTQLHVKATNNSAGDLYTAVGPGNVPSITIQNAGTTNNNNAALFFKDNDGHVASVAARFVSHTGGDEKVQLRFSVTGSGNTREKMTLTEDGYLGIGTVAPNYMMQAHRTSSSSNYMQITNSDTGSGSGDGFILGVASDEAATVWNFENTPMVFGTNGTARMRIHSGGEVSIGNTATIGSGAKTWLAVGDGSGNATLSMYTGSSNYAYINFADGTSGASADPGYIRYSHVHDSFYANRSFTAPNISSDEAMKENITDITDGWNIIKDLRPRKFDWKKDPLSDEYLPGMGQNASGFIAQEVETVLPGEVHSHDGGMKGLSQIGIVAYLVKTVQELEARIKELEG